MSVRFDDGTTDALVATLSPSLTATGDFSIGMWVKIITDNNATRNVGGFFPSGGGDNAELLRIDSTGTGLDTYLRSSDILTTYAVSTATWYYVVLSSYLSGTRYYSKRIFDESLTLLDTVATTYSWTPSGVDRFVLGYFSGYWNAGDVEIESVKVQTGVTWSDAECQTEAASYSVVKSGGTDVYAWKLTGVSADTDGLYEIGGAGPNFSNTGVVAGASTPSPLSAPYSPPVLPFTKILFRNA